MGRKFNQKIYAIADQTFRKVVGVITTPCIWSLHRGQLSGSKPGTFFRADFLDT